MKKILLSTICLMIVFTTLTGMIGSLGHEVKVVSFSPKPIIKGNINGKNTFFLLDTGADVSLLNLNSEEDLGFKTEPSLEQNKIHGVQGGGKAVKATRKVDMYLGCQQIKSRFMAFNLDHVVKSIQLKTGIRISGIIGSDVMRRYGFIIDYSSHKVLIQKTK